jgi:hypothetical protein
VHAGVEQHTREHVLLHKQRAVALNVARWTEEVARPAARRHLSHDRLVILAEFVGSPGPAPLAARAQHVRGRMQPVLGQVPVHLSHCRRGAAAARRTLIPEPWRYSAAHPRVSQQVAGCCCAGAGSRGGQARPTLKRTGDTVATEPLRPRHRLHQAWAAPLELGPRRPPHCQRLREPGRRGGWSGSRHERRQFDPVDSQHCADS